MQKEFWLPIQPEDGYNKQHYIIVSSVSTSVDHYLQKAHLDIIIIIIIPYLSKSLPFTAFIFKILITSMHLSCAIMADSGSNV